MNVDLGLMLMAACYAAGALSALLARWTGRLALGVGHGATLAGSVAGLGVSLGILLGPPGRTLTQPLPAFFGFARMSLAVDGLSAYFLLVVLKKQSRQYPRAPDQQRFLLCLEATP